MACDGIVESDSPETFLSGVRFVLCGFDPVSESQYRAELVRRGAVDAGSYGPSCTHVIVSGRVYDDPVCVAARNDGKMLVTELWIEDCVDFSSLADTSRIIYRPVKDFNGIPGSDKLCICLTGYQRRERDDIMKMVELMGANFSKPLIANKITHLICYKFEGEKYELAKKVNIKLVNHLWLEDCLKSWQILPPDSYIKSGWEIEIQEAEAKDSEEETEDESKNPLILRSAAGFYSSQNNTQTTGNINMSAQKKSASRTGTGSLSVFSTNINNHVPNMEDPESLRNLATCNNMTPVNVCQDASDPSINVESKKNGGKLPLSTGIFSATMCSDADQENNTPTKLLKVGKKSLSSESFILQELSPHGNLVGKTKKPGPDSAVPTREQGQSKTEAFDIRIASAKMHSNNMDDLSNSSAQKRKAVMAGIMTGSPKSGQNTGVHVFSNASTSSTFVGLDVPSETTPDSAKYGQKVAKAGSNFSIGHGVGPTSFISSSYKRRNLGIGQSLSGIEVSETVSVSSSLANGNDEIRKGANISAISSGTLPALGDGSLKKIQLSVDNSLAQMHDNSNSMKLSSNKHIADGAQEMETQVVRDRIISEPPTIQKNLGIMLEDIMKCEVEKDEVPGSNSNPVIQTADIGKKALEIDERTLPPKSMDSSDAGNSRSQKVVQTSDTRKTKVATKKLGSRIRAIGKSYAGKSAAAEKLGKSTGGIRLLDSENTEAAKPVMTTSNKILADTVPEQVVFSENVIKASPRSSSKSSNKKIHVDIPENSGKENKPLTDKSYSNSKCTRREDGDKHDERLKEDNNKACEMKSESTGENNKVVLIPEPVCFLLSGHRLQRKEFRQVIRRLRGRVCRDSHQWSYQATHLIVPDPVRRTEKFFAAAAAGRWILKMDYLTASNEAGNFLQEEPFEWYKNGLSEDGTINLAAPRKWRNLRERTGHGALYGMRILVYGECIVPSLDTLKRVVKAGDGTILATCPPYTRFLKSGVDLAIISPGMPRVDIWVQEFLRHEIPCVLIDYLVEYVCKPGYPLERHVLFNTHAWADKFFSNHQSRLEEIVCDPSTISEEDDLPCIICGSRDRAEVMLICGNEVGTAGCGIGTHIDCCNPPLDAVPVDDWFCPKCSTECKLNNAKVKGRKKGKSSMKHT